MSRSKLKIESLCDAANRLYQAGVCFNHFFMEVGMTAARATALSPNAFPPSIILKGFKKKKHKKFAKSIAEVSTRLKSEVQSLPAPDNAKPVVKINEVTDAALEALADRARASTARIIESNPDRARPFPLGTRLVSATEWAAYVASKKSTLGAGSEPFPMPGAPVVDWDAATPEALADFGSPIMQSLYVLFDRAHANAMAARNARSEGKGVVVRPMPGHPPLETPADWQAAHERVRARLAGAALDLKQ